MVSYSTLSGGASIEPHCGPMNLRLRVHVPLRVPDGECGLMVGGEAMDWSGDAIVFDDSYEHSAWNRTDSERVVLLFDVWHPELERDEVRAVEEMFAEARREGWLGGA